MRQPALHNNKQSGQAIVLIAMVMVALIAALGLAIDGGGMFLLYRDVQNATDSAGLSAAFALCSGGDPEEAGRTAARLNGFVDGADGATVTVSNPPPADHEFGFNNIGARSGNYIVTTIEAEKPSYFIGVVYNGPLIVSLDTISQCTPAVGFGWPENSAVVSLSPSCAAFGGSSQPPFKAVGTADHETIGGGIYINGDSSSCDAASENGSADVTAGGYGVCGHNTIDSGIATPEGSINENCPDGPITGTNPLYPDPYVDAGLQAPDCASMPARTLDTSGNNILTTTPGPGDPGYNLPGRYTDFDIGTNGEAYLSTGIYCIDGTTGSNSSEIKWQGVLLTDETDGVMFYLYDSVESLDSTAQADVQLFALTDEDSDYTNLLIWDDAPAVPSNSRAISLAGQTVFELEGTVYAPRAHCSISGGSSPNLIYGQFICYSGDFSGNSGVTIIFDPSRIFKIPPEFGVTQ